MSVDVVTPPSELPVSLADARLECRISADDTSHDADMTRYIKAATAYCQKVSRRQFVTATLKQTVRPTCHRVPIGAIPFQAITSVVDGDGGDVEYTLDRSRLRPQLVLESIPEELVVTFTAGFGDQEDVPEDNKTAILKLTRILWRRQDDAIPPGVAALLDKPAWFA